MDNCCHMGIVALEERRRRGPLSAGKFWKEYHIS